MKKTSKKILCILIMIASFGSATAVTAASNGRIFTDIDQSYAKEAINRLVQQGILHGIDNTHFNPGDYLTRAEFTAILVRLLQLPIDASLTSSDEFSDVSGWALPYTIVARNAGLVDGISDNRFNPNGLLTREQAAKLLVSALALTNPSIVINEQAVPSFKDSNLISGWAKPYVAKAAELGLISGKPDGTFDPKSNASREMAAIMGVNLLDLLDMYRGNPTDESIKLPPPTNFSTSGFDETGITFTWNAPADSTSITGYDVFMGWDDSKIGSTTGTSFTIQEVDPNVITTVFFVRSKDAQGRLSDRSNHYIYTTTNKTELKMYPELFHNFTYGQEQQTTWTVTGKISQNDVRQHALLYASIDGVTSKDISFGAITGFGEPEIVQEGKESQPLVITWGGANGIELSSYLWDESRLNLSIQLPITLHKRGLHAALFELRTAGDAPINIASSKVLFTGELLKMTDQIIKPDIMIQIQQPLPAQVNQQITIPVTVQGNVSSEQLTDLVALYLRIIDDRQVLEPADIQIEDIDKFGHASVVFNGKDQLVIQFDRPYQLGELKQELANGITFNLIITLRQSGKFGVFATLEHIDENGGANGGSSSGNVVQVLVH